MRRRFTRFNKEEYFKHNMAIVDTLKTLAEKKGVTPAQLTLAWVASLSPKVIPIPGSSYVPFPLYPTRGLRVLRCVYNPFSRALMSLLRFRDTAPGHTDT